VPDRVDMGYNQRTRDRTDCTIRALPRSLGPDPVALFCQVSACQYLPYSDCIYPCLSTMLPVGTPTSRAMTGHLVCSRKKTLGPSALNVS
jgi:hypothetical protein